ncbi:hypothetical protein ACSSS7_000889 [Eimeria intestinalis]
MWGPPLSCIFSVFLLVLLLSTALDAEAFRGSKGAFINSSLALLPGTRHAACYSSNTSSSSSSGISSLAAGDKPRCVSPRCLCRVKGISSVTAKRTAATAAAASTATSAVVPATSPSGGLSDRASEGATNERFPFQAEVKRVLDIIVHSLYTDKDVFLRELVSNAADACDKKRVLLQEQKQQEQPQHQQQQQDQQQQQQEWKGSIRVYADKTAGTLIIEDDGVGMSRQELIDHLGTIAQSGTYKFAQHLQQQQQERQQEEEDQDVQSANDLIGQFGVGFYSAFLVADKVEVVSSRWWPQAAAPTSAATSAPTSSATSSATGGGGATTASADKPMIPEVWKWSSSCGQTFSVERVDGEEEQRRWEQQTRELHRQLQEQAAKAGNIGVSVEQRQQEQQQQDVWLQQQLLQPWTGTRVVLHLREDCDDYLEDYRLRDLLKKYSEFLPVPIYLLGERVEYERVQDTSETTTTGVGEGRTPVGGGAAPPRFKTVTHRFTEWSLLNTQAPIWRRPENTLTEKDYVDFYKATFKMKIHVVFASMFVVSLLMINSKKPSRGKQLQHQQQQQQQQQQWKQQQCRQRWQQWQQQIRKTGPHVLFR